MIETELKFDLSAEAAEALLASETLPGPPTAKRQRSIYFDTPDHALRGAGASLRIRHVDGHRIQTMKVAREQGAGLFSRAEWEAHVESDRPFIEPLTPVLGLLGRSVRDLRPVFEVEVRRECWIVEDGCASVEVVLDRGAVRIGDRFSPICELELEVKAGDPAALFALAGKLRAAVPLRVGVITKSERGYRLADTLCGFAKAEEVLLSRNMDAAASFRRIIASSLRHFRLNEDLLLKDRAPEALHQARVALRRMRSAFSIYRPILGAEQARDLRDRLRDLARALGPARDLDVLLERLEAGELRDRLLEERDAAYEGALTALSGAQSRELMIDLLVWLETGSRQTDPEAEALRAMPARSFAQNVLTRFRRKVKKGGRDLAGLSDEARHELRKDAKKLRYAVDFFGTLFDGKSEAKAQKEFRSALKGLQGVLGELNDLATALEILRRYGVADLAGLNLGRKKRTLVPEAAAAYARLIDANRYWRG